LSRTFTEFLEALRMAGGSQVLLISEAASHKVRPRISS